MSLYITDSPNNTSFSGTSCRSLLHRKLFPWITRYLVTSQAACLKLHGYRWLLPLIFAPALASAKTLRQFAIFLTHCLNCPFSLSIACMPCRACALISVLRPIAALQCCTARSICFVARSPSAMRMMGCPPHVLRENLTISCHLLK